MADGFQGPPAVSFYNMLSGLGDTIQNNAKVAREQGLRDAFPNGLPKGPDGSIDFGAVGNTLSQHGADLGTVLTVAKLAEDQHRRREELGASSDFRSTIGNMFGGFAPKPAPAPALPSPTDPNAPRMPVAPTSKVWGDKEAEDAGLYEPASGPKTASYGQALGRQPIPLPVGLQPQPAQPAQPQPAIQQPAPQAAQPAPLPARTGFQGISIEHAPQLISAMANPRLPSGDRELAGKLLTRALDDAKEPERIRTLTALKEQSGYPGTILQLEMEMRRAGKTDVTTNIDQKGETEEAKSAGKHAGDRRAAMIDAANGATNNLASLTRVQTLLDQVQQGKLQPGRMTVSAWAKSFGVNDDFAKSLGLDPKSVGTSQAIQALTNELVLGKIGHGGFPANNFSDADRQFLIDTLPKLGNDPRANSILIEAAKRVHNSSIQRALDYQSWKEDPANKGRGFEDFELRRASKIAQMDKFGDLRKQAETLLSAPARSGNAGGIEWSVQ